MFIINNKNIGNHLAYLIKNNNYKSDRQFGIAYLKLRDNTEAPAPDDIQKIQNRICQIKKGNKGVQIEDLPIFAELLHVSIEEILSAGTSIVPVSSRASNYSIVFSKDPDEWDAYIKREDKLILNPDEYNKTVIDYALESRNYPFLKYLMDKGYIWFVGNNKNEYFPDHFGAGCSIERRNIGYTDILDAKLKEQDDLRFKMISLAITNKDFDILNTLHAREIPLLYNINHVFHHNLKNERLPKSRNVELMIDSIASSNNTTLSYFFEEFVIVSQRSASPNTFIFPYADALLDAMIGSRSKNTCRFLEKAIAYNKKVQKKLQQYVDESIESYREFFMDSENHNINNDDYYKHEVWRDYYIYPETGFVAFRTPFFAKKTPAKGFITNIIHATAKSANPKTQFLIDELNETYNTFIKQYEHKEG